MRQICNTLGFNRSSLYYEPKKDTCEEARLQEIEMLAARYPRYGYRWITEELVRMGHITIIFLTKRVFFVYFYRYNDLLDKIFIVINQK